MLTKQDLQSIGSLMDGKIDALKTLIQGEFNGISDRFDKVDDRFDVMDKKIDFLQLDMNNKFVSLNNRISEMTFEITQIKIALKKERKFTMEDYEVLEKKMFKAEGEIKILKTEMKKIRINMAK